MAKHVNKVILLGNVGKDPEVKFLPSGAAVARTAEIVRDYVKKGSKLYVEGRLTTRSWDDKDTGKKVYRTEIMVNDLVLLSGRGDGEGGGGGGSTSYSKSGSSSGAQGG